MNKQKYKGTKIITKIALQNKKSSTWNDNNKGVFYIKRKLEEELLS